jgi:hypothetical protein
VAARRESRAVVEAFVGRHSAKHAGTAPLTATHAVVVDYDFLNAKEMQMKTFALLGTIAFVTISASAGIAAEKAINLSLFTPISIAKETDSVTAFRFNLLYGKNTSVEVVDLGLVNHTTSGLSRVLQWGAVNIAEADFKGLQLAAVNYNSGSFEGVQWGGVNITNNGDGLQFSIVNYAKKYHGLQIGLINIISEGGWMPVFPIVNWAF